jgi:hypothetical protein
MENLTKGLALEELEAHSFAELLPDRIEMRRRRSVNRRLRRRSGNVECTANLQLCNRINA